MQINYTGDSPYAQTIIKYFEQQFYKVTPIGKSSLLEILSDIIIGTKEMRYGPIGPPESIVNIRNVIRDAIHKRLPIPMLAPWGGKKAVKGQLLDVAEISGIRQLIHLDEQVKKFFEPGLQTVIAIEDRGAEWLYREQEGIEDEVSTYSDNFEMLVHMISGNANIMPFREGDVMKHDEYFEKSTALSQVIFNFLLFSNQYPNQIGNSPQYKALLDSGWKGDIPTEQRSYYINRYLSLYPGISIFKATQMLADYLAGAKVRYDLGGKGTPVSDVTGFIKASFSPPIPGVPPGFFDTTAYYRTVPMSHGRTHVAPWRAKGYLKIDGKSGEVITKVTNWHDPILENLESHKVQISAGDSIVEVQTDYLVSE